MRIKYTARVKKVEVKHWFFDTFVSGRRVNQNVTFEKQLYVNITLISSFRKNLNLVLFIREMFEIK